MAFELKPFPASELKTPEVRNHLVQHGFVWVSGFFAPGEIDQINSAVDSMEARIEYGSPDDPELPLSGPRRNYSQLAASPVTTVDIRGREASYDGGMIDIFKPRIWLSARYPQLDSVLDRLAAPAVSSLIGSVDARLRPCHSNIYIHKAVTNPRVPHVDAVRDFFKIFAALSDHSAAGCGPLLVYPGSHARRAFNRVMCFYNARFKSLSGAINVDDATLYDPKNMVALRMKPGDIAICNQSIVHSAMPAADHGYRRTFVQVFDLPKGEQ